MNEIYAAIARCKTLADFQQAAMLAAYLVYMIGGEKVRNQPDGFYGRSIAEILN